MNCQTVATEVLADGGRIIYRLLYLTDYQTPNCLHVTCVCFCLQ